TVAVYFKPPTSKSNERDDRLFGKRRRGVILQPPRNARAESRSPKRSTPGPECAPRVQGTDRRTPARCGGAPPRAWRCARRPERRRLDARRSLSAGANL